MTIFGITLSAAVIWLIIAAVCGIIEAATMGLTTIWFTGGAIIASIVAMAKFSLPIQIIVFLIVSILLIYFTRPLAKKRLKIGNEKTNVDALVGREAMVTGTIEPFGSGQAKVDGLVWSAIAKDSHTTIQKGTTVIIDRVEGVKLVVTPSEEPITK
ncbi:NfeD family protein [Ihubacter massiliensis]|uniref:NfeD family protein n=1 Tax=Hominibacterium faecale TaxID=2839743 RepID=A0A9J6QXT8_9FIRM|nr:MULTISPECIES: NfeD family protein [Eubacteriales Family XIII. Incertae Sedis]MCO7123656.1 NfeD family protein [Ihubacter massiliensis]MCU7380311.1 NfeD family protein [Hominibacterium faecale]